MYYIDTMTQKLDAFDFDGSTGSITNRRCVYNFDKDSNDGNFLGYPDGMTIDSNDTLWIAMWDGWCVYNVDPVQKVIVAKYDFQGKELKKPRKLKRRKLKKRKKRSVKGPNYTKNGGRRGSCTTVLC